ncbi:hypothetical protein TcWFU_001082 [Taenia crassiceps]|uniref:Uncharacterized protein n=1 Tax=Taenia crassiceps TaxID=6207 RepID=A0ABR4QC49_9CEST
MLSKHSATVDWKPHAWTLHTPLTNRLIRGRWNSFEGPRCCKTKSVQKVSSIYEKLHSTLTIDRTQVMLHGWAQSWS